MGRGKKGKKQVRRGDAASQTNKDAEAYAKEKEASWSHLPSLGFEASTKEKEVSRDMEQPPTIWLFMDHRLRGMEHALYKIQLPLDLSDYNQMIDSDGYMTDSKNIYPVLTFKEPNFMPLCASVTLGSSIYFFGGVHDYVEDKRLHCKVQVFDTDHPEQGLRTVAPLNRPKWCPCVFAADGMIYALGSYLGKIRRERENPSGYFERYDPILDRWQALPDPPLDNEKWALANFLDCATVVGRRVFIGGPYLYVIFNLDDQDWERVPSGLGSRLCCASSFVPASASLYSLRHPRLYHDPVKVVRRGPLTTTIGTMEQSDDYVKNLLNSPCLDSGKEQIVAEGTDLEDIFFSYCDFDPCRNFVYMGDRFFCYVLSALLVDDTHTEPDPEPVPRGVWIKILEEVPAAKTPDGSSKAKFRTLATFCYKIDTNFDNQASYVRCSVFGTVPDSWVKAPLEKKLSIKPYCKSKKNEPLLFGWPVTPAEGGEWCELENANKKLLAVEEENRRLVAELAEKEMLLKKYQVLESKALHVQC